MDSQDVEKMVVVVVAVVCLESQCSATLASVGAPLPGV